nr:MAG TPA: hypothetical protein [Caudoviricetes sp.]
MSEKFRSHLLLLFHSQALPSQIYETSRSQSVLLFLITYNHLNIIITYNFLFTINKV